MTQEQFDEQVAQYCDSGLPSALGYSDEAFRRWVEPLREHVPADPSDADLPIVLIVPGAGADAAMPLVRQGEHAGYVDMRPVGPAEFRPVVPVPTSPYLLIDVRLGRDSLGIPPSRAGADLAARGRSALTIEEGIAVALLHPGILRRHHAIQMLASRDSSKRIPSLWVTKDGRPRLGWCFEGVPHSWMGTASAAERRSAG